MHDSSRALGRHIRGPRVPHTLAAQAPVADPPAASAPAHPAPPTTERPPQRPLGAEGPDKPSPRRAPVRLTPLGLFLAQTILDMVAVAASFGVAYWLRFESDIFRKYVTPDQATYL